jgi:hypothetical protein
MDETLTKIPKCPNPLKELEIGLIQNSNLLVGTTTTWNKET